MITDNTPQLQALHELFCFHAHQQLHFEYFRWRWEAWSVMAGHTKETLELVLQYINHRRLTASEEKYKPRFTLNKVLDDHGWFACQVQAAESWQRETAARKRRPTDVNRQEMLRATGRTTDPPAKVVTPAQILPKTQEEIAEMARKWAADLRATL